MHPTYERDQQISNARASFEGHFTVKLTSCGKLNKQSKHIQKIIGRAPLAFDHRRSQTPRASQTVQYGRL